MVLLVTVRLLSPPHSAAAFGIAAGAAIAAGSAVMAGARATDAAGSAGHLIAGHRAADDAECVGGGDIGAVGVDGAAGGVAAVAARGERTR